MAAQCLPAVKAWQLKYWAFLTGMQTTGTKAELQTLLTSRLDDPPPLDRPTKVVSVDMGIRNLAYCAIEAPALDLHVQDYDFKEELSRLNRDEKELLRRHTSSGSSRIKDLRNRLQNQAVKVTAWKRMDLTNNDTTGDEQSPSSRAKEKNKATKPEPRPEVPAEAFTPAHLSRTALKVTQELLSHNPTTILIERQRFRSGGAAAIQEWTVRVNMLESMIWACLSTLRAHRTTPHKETPSFPDVHAISPAQVVNFWSSPSSISLLPPTLFSPSNEPIQHMLTQAMNTRKKMDKKDKVELVKTWCRSFNADSNVPMQFSEESRPVACAFKAESRRRTKDSKERKLFFQGKLDDVADCLLQGVTWIRWEQNRRVLAGFWRKAVEEANREESD